MLVDITRECALAGRCSRRASTISNWTCRLLGSSAQTDRLARVPVNFRRGSLGATVLTMSDPCQPDLTGTPHVTAQDGWVWSRQNAPVSSDENRCGKWMLFPRCAQAVSAWRIVAQAGHDGQIWLAKISPRATRGRHLICVYTADFTDQADVETVVRRLDTFGLV